MTCEQCGADAMSAGVCQNCGWRAPASRTDLEANADFLEAETREADVPVRTRRPVTARNFGPPTPYPGALPLAGGAPVTPRMAPRTSPGGLPGPAGPYGAAGPATGRFCGTCGARIEAGQLFCGQCGAAVSTFEGSAVNHPTSTSHPDYSSQRYSADDSDVWSPADQDAPTEQWEPMQSMRGGMGRTPAYRASGSFSPAAPVFGMSREMRVLLGILCIVGALISGAGAIILAFVH